MNTFVISLKTLKRNKGYTFINIAGLAIGIAACMLIFLIVRYELSYDKFQPAYKNIYHVITSDKYPDGMYYNPGIPFPALKALRNDFPQITTGTIFSSYRSQVTVLDESGKSSGKKFVEEPGLVFADPEFFRVFRYQWLTGNENVLARPDAAVLTKSTATKYFGSWQNATGRLISFDNILTYKVDGIIEDPPGNTDFPLRAIGSFESMKQTRHYGYSTDWGATTSNFQLFVLLPDNMTPPQMDEQLKAFSKKYYSNGLISRRVNLLQPLSEVHFDTRVSNFSGKIISRSTIYTLTLVGALIILMACINFINLSTVQAVKRSKEIGIRKVLGSNRWQLFRQVLAETGTLVLLAALLAFGIAYLSLPYLKHIASIEERLSIVNLTTLGFTVALLLLITVLAGFYPALVLSAFRPVQALKSKVNSASIGGISLRRALVFVQFGISQALIIGTIVAVCQMNFVREADLGFNKEAVFVMSASNDSIVRSRQSAFRERLLKIAGVRDVSFCSDVPSSDNDWGSNFAFDHKPDEQFTIYLKFGDEDYFKTFGLQLVAGSVFPKSDTVNGFVVNETLLKKLNIKNPSEAIGKDLKLGGGKWKPITGVVKDFKTNSLKQEIKPLAISSRKTQYNIVSVKLNTANIEKTRQVLEAEWDKFYPEYAATSYFMDESIERFYSQETQLALLYKIFSALAIFISCLGLYGLISFMTVQKTREVGIRKVLGANVYSIVLLFSREFTILIVLAFLVSAPLAWYFMKNWLNNFAFRIEMGIGIFMLALILSLLVAWVSVGYKALQAALTNPVKNLRTE
jgi:predicted permease